MQEKIKQSDIQLLFSGFVKLIKHSAELEVKEEHFKQMSGIKKQLNALSIKNYELEAELTELKNLVLNAEKVLGYTLQDLLKAKK